MMGCPPKRPFASEEDGLEAAASLRGAIREERRLDRAGADVLRRDAREPDARAVERKALEELEARVVEGRRVARGLAQGLAAREQREVRVLELHHDGAGGEPRFGEPLGDAGGVREERAPDGLLAW